MKPNHLLFEINIIYDEASLSLYYPLKNPKALTDLMFSAFLLHFITPAFEQCLTLVSNCPSLLDFLLSLNAYTDTTYTSFLLVFLQPIVTFLKHL